MIDQIERQWHTASVCAAIQGNEIEDWFSLLERFDEYLLGETRPLSEEEERRKLLGLK